MLFKLNSKLIKELDKVEKNNLVIKDYIEFLKNSNETLKYERANIINQTNKCETCVLMKKEVKYLYERKSRSDSIQSKVFLE